MLISTPLAETQKIGVHRQPALQVNPGEQTPSGIPPSPKPTKRKPTILEPGSSQANSTQQRQVAEASDASREIQLQSMPSTAGTAADNGSTSSPPKRAHDRADSSDSSKQPGCGPASLWSSVSGPGWQWQASHERWSSMRSDAENEVRVLLQERHNMQTYQAQKRAIPIVADLQCMACLVLFGGILSVDLRIDT